MKMVNKTRRILIIHIAIAAFAATAFAQPWKGDSLTIESAVRQAIASSPALLQAEANVRASGSRVDQAKTADLPTVGFDGSYVRIGPVPQLYFPGMGSFKLYPENNYDAHVGIRQKVYDFGKSSATVDLSQSRVRSAEIAGDLVRLGITYQTIQVFNAILFLEQSIQVENQEIQTLQQHLAVTKKRTETGSGTDFEVLTTQVRVASAQNQLIDMENMLEKQRIAMRRLLGVPDSTSIRIHGNFQLTETNANIDSLTSMALAQRPEYRGAKAEEQSASLQYRLTQVADMPTLNIQAAYGVKNGYIPNLDVLHGNWVAGVALNVPLYEGNKTSYKEEEAQATLSGSQSHVLDIQRQISSEVQQASSDVRSAREKYDRSLLQVEQATLALSIAQKRFDAGTVSNLDVLDAETSLSQAHLLRLRALYEFVSSRYALERSIGTPMWK